MVQAKLARPSGPGDENRMAFLFRLETTDGAPAEPATPNEREANWRAEDTIPVDSRRTLRVLDVRDDDAHELPVLVVEDVSA
jgi:hypothetical protein